MRVYLAGGVKSLESWLMKMFLAESGGIWGAYFTENNFKPAYILQSFYYVNDYTEKIILPNCKGFMLDSGAFSFSANTKIKVNWEEYLERYADWINAHKIDLFFELDIDSIIGYENVLKLRAKLEKLTNKQPIPVWHVDRGKEEFIRHCEEYPYVALGGYVAAIQNKDARQKLYVKSYPWFIKEAHRRGTKIHGLGFTSLEGLAKYHFDSVDSTAWTTGNRFGYVYYFDGQTMRKRDVPRGFRLCDARMVAIHNFNEWAKFAEYAERKY